MAGKRKRKVPPVEEPAAGGEAPLDAAQEQAEEGLTDYELLRQQMCVGGRAYPPHSPWLAGRPRCSLRHPGPRHAHAHSPRRVQSFHAFLLFESPPCTGLCSIQRSS